MGSGPSRHSSIVPRPTAPAVQLTAAPRVHEAVSSYRHLVVARPVSQVDRCGQRTTCPLAFCFVRGQG